mmetsp:Transcript_96/g.218  ORF Transcript_96/g.218 Transcript_96/m.218 type:complete len:148 (+) Transcript_96:290-733(+)
MCHSDAFCHVSRLQDDFVKSPEEILRVGDDVMPRVVEINRKLKRITVSLQSDARAEDEKASIEAHQKRIEKRQKKRNKKLQPPPQEKTAKQVDEKSEPETSGSNNLVDAQGNYLLDEADMTPAQLKRARKLARRASRRMQKEAEQSS